MKKKFQTRLKRLKVVAIYLVLNMIFNLAFPTVSMALTSGPASPEFSSFEPVATTDMVDPFTGNFTYNLPVLNIPGPDGGGYAMSLSYHSGVTSEEEASWVGLGWTLNAGAINRGKVGFPDEFNGVTVHRFNKTVPVWTSSVTIDGALEINSKDKGKRPLQDRNTNKDADQFQLDLFSAVDPEELEGFQMVAKGSASLRYNNYQGFTRTNGFSTSYKGMASLNMSRTGGESTFGFSVNPLVIFLAYRNKKTKEAKEELDEVLGSDYCSDEVEAAFEKNARAKYGKALGISRKLPKYMKYINPSISPSNINTFPGFSVARTIGEAYNFSSSVQVNTLGPIGVEVGYSGNHNFQTTIPQSDMEAFGYMHSPNWADYYDDLNKEVENPFNEYPDAGDNEDSKIIADYFIEHESSFNKHDKYIGVPFNAADQFIMTGEGIIGGFRMHQPQIGHYFPTPVVNKQKIKQLGVEFGVGQTIQVGMDLGIGYQRTEVGNWKENLRDYVDITDYEFKTTCFARFNNDMGGSLRYSESDDLYSAYFNLNKTLRVEDSLELLSPLQYEVPASSTVIFSEYDDAGNIHWQYFDENSNSNYPGPLDKLANTESLREIRPANGIAEILTVNPNGERYIYGLPVYARSEENLVYGVRHAFTDAIKKDNGTASSGVPSTVNMPVNNAPLANQTVIGDVVDEAYATAYLLTQITSPNYVDINDNGPDARDYGGWTKFMYRKKHGGDNSTVPEDPDDEWYHHRVPYSGLFYDKGRINNYYDQTGSVSRGAKEVCFLKAVETKTHIAFFVTNEVVGTDFNDLVNELTDDEAMRTKIKTYLNGSGDMRYDALGAINPEKGSGDMDLAANGELPNVLGQDAVKRMEKLEKIVLFSKDRLELPLTSTHFEYSYELCKGVPNNAFNASDVTAINVLVEGDLDFSKSGKLTLKKVWTESEGVVRSKIAPYQFDYNYFDNYQANIATRYAEIATEYQGLLENPDYKFDLLDPWGNYQDLGISKGQRDKLRSWMSQGESPSNFDPAAWHLKRIVLPSGGEIHIQYEQKDYAYVQDKQAMAMVSLHPNAELYVNKMKYDENLYYINTEDVNVSTTEEKNEYYDQLVDYFFDILPATEVAVKNDDIVNVEEEGVSRKADNSVLYFQFLYSYWQEYLASIHPIPGSERQVSDFIDGYTAVYEIGKNSNGIYFRLGDNKKNKFNVPRRLCRENLLTNGGEALLRNDDITLDFDQINSNLKTDAYQDPLVDDGDQDDEKAVFDKMKEEVKDQDVASHLFFGGLVGFKVKNPRKGHPDVCSNLDPVLSYLKLPVYHAKKGGGIRVKRLLTYNSGIESGEESLYGTEYIYKLEDGSSSGVATYEPQGNRRENPLVDLLPRLKQRLYNKLISGRDKAYQEGPLGEHLYPSPSVGHSRVVMKNIHSGKSAPGFVVNNYLTCKEHPSVQMESTEIHHKPNKETAHYRKSKINIPLGIFNYKKDNAWITQGYLFKISDLHGKLESALTYGGAIDSELPAINSQNNSLLASVTNEYSDMDDLHKSIRMDNNRKFILNDNYRPGEEEDVTLYMGRVENRTNDFSIEFDLSIMLGVPPLFNLGFMPQVNMQETELSQHVTCRVIRRNSMLTKVTTYAEGIESTTEYLAYDHYTGNPVLTKTIDHYEGKGSPTVDKDRLYEDPINTQDHAYYAMSIPASWIYPEMGQKSVNLNNLNLLNANAGSIVTYMSNPLEKFDVNGVWDPYTDEIDNVIAASSVEFRKDRFDEEFMDVSNTKLINTSSMMIEYDAQVGTDGFTTTNLETMNKFFYPVATYAFIGKVVSANTETSYKGGVLDGFSFFDWDETSANNAAAGWKYASQITKFSPHGHPLEELNILGIPSAVKFGYGKLLPVMVAANSEYETMAFEDFETGNGPTTPYAAHTGKKSRKFNSSETTILLSNIKLTERLYNKGGHFKVWLQSKVTGAENTSIPSLNLSGVSYPLAKVARVGEWSLYHVYITNWGSLSIGQTLTAMLNYTPLSGEKLYIDDVCFNPMEGAVNCTVYDPASFRVVAQFSDQHFATIYEYNYEGQLIRTVIETERGRKTVMEQQYNVLRKPNTP